MSDRQKRVDIPFQELPILVARLNVSDFDFCKKVTKDAHKLWVHFCNDASDGSKDLLELSLRQPGRTDPPIKTSIEVRETDIPTPRTLFVTSMKGAKITTLNRYNRVLNLSEPITFIYNDREISFNQIDLSHLTQFKQHLRYQVNIAREHFVWPQYEISDTGITRSKAWNTFTK